MSQVGSLFASRAAVASGPGTPIVSPKILSASPVTSGVAMPSLSVALPLEGSDFATEGLVSGAVAPLGATAVCGTDAGVGA
jgi:hypothetical protein